MICLDSNEWSVVQVHNWLQELCIFHPFLMFVQISEMQNRTKMRIIIRMWSKQMVGTLLNLASPQNKYVKNIILISLAASSISRLLPTRNVSRLLTSSKFKINTDSSLEIVPYKICDSWICIWSIIFKIYSSEANKWS